MSIVAFFEAPGTSQQQYDQVIKELEAQGVGAPDGLLYHVAWDTPQGWRVLDIWESEEKFGKFAEILTPIIADVGAPAAEPQIYPVHNIISG